MPREGAPDDDGDGAGAGGALATVEDDESPAPVDADPPNSMAATLEALKAQDGPPDVVDRYAAKGAAKKRKKKRKTRRAVVRAPLFLMLSPCPPARDGPFLREVATRASAS